MPAAVDKISKTNDSNAHNEWKYRYIIWSESATISDRCFKTEI